MNAYVFPGQGSQYPGMGNDLYESGEEFKKLFENANDILGFNITKTMFEGSEEDLKQTNITQPAIFIHSVLQARKMKGFKPDMVAGHSLGEFSALTAVGGLTFEDGLKLVAVRANAMQKACVKNPSTMAAVLGLEDEVVEQVCNDINEVVVAANYNCPKQLVISGSHKGIEIACEKLKEAGALRAIVLKVGGAFHSPLMEPAREELEEAIVSTSFMEPACPLYQNATAWPSIEPETIRKNLIKQLTAPVLWTHSVQHMIQDGATEFTEVGPGNVLQVLVKKIDRSMITQGV